MRPPAADESLFQHVARSTRNCVHSVFGCLQTSDEKAKIAYKEYLIESRKKKFGVDYINLKKTATAEDGKEQALEDCLQQCLKDIEGMEHEITALRQEIGRVENETKGKIQAKPGTTAANNTGSKPEAHASAGATTTTTTNPPQPTPPPAQAPAADQAPASTAAGETAKEHGDMQEVNLEDNKME